MDDHSSARIPSKKAGIQRSAATAQTVTSLNIGDPAPQITMGKWLVGPPIKVLQPGLIHVVEFWASWCGPCQLLMPELSKLQAEYPEIVVLSVSIWESDPFSPEELIRELGPSIKHRVCLDGPRKSHPDDALENTGRMAFDWMVAAGESAVPSAFIVDTQGRIAWIGHPAEIPQILPDLIAGKTVSNQTERLREKAFERLELDPTVAVDPTLFADLFSLKAPPLRKAVLDWLIPDLATPAVQEKPPAGKSGGIFGRLLGRSAAAPAVVAEVPVSQGLNVSGPPALGRPYALLISSVESDSVNKMPGWVALDHYKINTLPQLWPQIDFVSLVHSYDRIENLFDLDYRTELTNWGSELGWRIAFEVVEEDSSDTSNDSTTADYWQFWVDRYNLFHQPAAALVDPSGRTLWVGSPLHLNAAIEKWTSNQLAVDWVLGEFVYWHRLLASAEANERLAGVDEDRKSHGVNLESSSYFTGEPAVLENWDQTIKSLNEQLPWRADRWRVFQFQMDVAKARFNRSEGLSGKALVERFQALSDTFAESAALEPNAAADWLRLIHSAIDMLGLNSNSLVPLDMPALLAAESHPLTDAVLSSSKNFQATVVDSGEADEFHPSPLAFINFKLNRFDEALKEHEKMISDLDNFVEQMGNMVPLDDLSPEDRDASVQYLEFLISMRLGESAATYRTNLVKIQNLYRKYSEAAE